MRPPPRSASAYLLLMSFCHGGRHWEIHHRRHEGSGIMKIVLLDGYELNGDLDWPALRGVDDCNLYNRTPVDDVDEICHRIGFVELIITHKTPVPSSCSVYSPVSGCPLWVNRHILMWSSMTVPFIEGGCGRLYAACSSSTGGLPSAGASSLNSSSSLGLICGCHAWLTACATLSSLSGQRAA